MSFLVARGAIKCSCRLRWWSGLQGRVRRAATLAPLKRLEAATPLLLAAQLGLGNVVSRLLELGAALAALPSTGHTALHLAAIQGDLGVLRALKAHSSELEVRDNKGLTALHLACHVGHLKVVQELMDAGASVDLIPSPLDLASSCGSQGIDGLGPPGSPAAYLDIVKLLLEAKCHSSELRFHLNVTEIDLNRSKVGLEVLPPPPRWKSPVVRGRRRLCGSS